MSRYTRAPVGFFYTHLQKPVCIANGARPHFPRTLCLLSQGYLVGVFRFFLVLDALAILVADDSADLSSQCLVALESGVVSVRLGVKEIGGRVKRARRPENVPWYNFRSTL